MPAKNEVNQEKIIKCPSFRQNFWTRTLGFRTTKFNIVLVRRRSGSENFSLTLLPFLDYPAAYKTQKGPSNMFQRELKQRRF